MLRHALLLACALSACNASEPSGKGACPPGDAACAQRSRAIDRDESRDGNQPSAPSANGAVAGNADGGTASAIDRNQPNGGAHGGNGGAGSPPLDAATTSDAGPGQSSDAAPNAGPDAGGGTPGDGDEARRIDTATTSVNEPRVAIDEAGNAIAIWNHYAAFTTRTDDELWASRYQRGVGWDDPRMLKSGPGSIIDARVAMNDAGAAIVTWESPNNGLWSCRYSLADGWGEPRQVITGDARDPRAVMTEAGEAVAVWQQVGAGYQIFTSRWPAGGDWQTPGAIVPNGEAQTPSITLAGPDSEYAVWCQTASGTTRDDLWTSRYSAAQGWSPQLRHGADYGSDDYPFSQFPKIVANAIGSVVIVWESRSTQQQGVWLSDQLSSYSPTMAFQLNSVGSFGDEPTAAVDPNGNILAVWSQQSASDNSRSEVWATHYSPTDSWSAAVSIDTGDPGYVYYQTVGLDGAGNGLAVWQRELSDSAASLWLNRYRAGSGWGAPAPIPVAAGVVNPDDIHLAVSKSGHAMTVWAQVTDGTGQIWAQRFETKP